MWGLFAALFGTGLFWGGVGYWLGYRSGERDTASMFAWRYAQRHAVDGQSRKVQVLQ